MNSKDGNRKNEFWDSNYYNHPDLTDEMVEMAEKELGLKLPSLLIEFLKVQNGGYTKGFAYPMKQRTTWAEDHVPLSELFGIVTEKSFKTAQNILATHYMTKEWGLPEKQVLLAGDGHWWITLDYRKGNIPSVR
ncbi:SMI1/KNR4 family protein [Pontibacter virosus]|uniref:SUKH superfamily protein n=1 Tax=Pontibacter virosus TaxID=1765052 RepID=A0A2U1ANH0_9BACT|nr:SMI1/KNR4 family protein [Pontibacter virosus]PVY37962.1 SUKH superfamily protein [Pontibacter virosus]